MRTPRLLLPVVTVAAAALAGCAGDPGAPPPPRSPSPVATGTEPVEIYFAVFGGGGPHLDWISAEIGIFDELRDDVTVDYTADTFYSRPVVPYEKLQQRYFAEGPDLVAGFIGGSLRPDAEAGRFTDLTDLWQELGLEDAVPASIAELASVDGRRYWVPTVAQWNPVFYNTDAFDAAELEPPETWDELLSACASLRAAGIDRPMAQAGERTWTPPAARWFSAINLGLNGPDLHERLARGEVAWTDPRIREAFSHWDEMIEAGCYGDPILHAYQDAIARLSDGRAAMYNLGEWIFESALLSDDDPIDFFSPPRIDPQRPRSEIVLVYGLGIPADAAHPEAARDLLRHLVSAEALTRGYETLQRLIPDRRVDPGYLPRHTKGLQLFEQADHLVELWEFAAVSPQGEIGIELFTSYLADPTGLEEYLAEAEGARREAFGPSDGG